MAPNGLWAPKSFWFPKSLALQKDDCSKIYSGEYIRCPISLLTQSNPLYRREVLLFEEKQLCRLITSSTVLCIMAITFEIDIL